MNLTVSVPDDLAARLTAVGASPERLALDALRQAAEDMERAQASGSTGRDSTRSGEALIAALQASPAREIDLAPPRGPLPVRGVAL